MSKMKRNSCVEDRQANRRSANSWPFCLAGPRTYHLGVEKEVPIEISHPTHKKEKELARFLGVLANEPEHGRTSVDDDV